MAAKAKRGSYTCGNCGGEGHNARKCPDKVTKTSKKKTPKKKPSKKSTPKADAKLEDAVTREDAVDTIKQVGEAASIDKETVDKAVDTVKNMPDEAFDLDGPEGAQVEAPEEEESSEHQAAALNTPQRKRKRSKAELAFWEKSTEKIAPDAVAEASTLSMQIPRISTGNFGLDVALYGGIPQGRIVRFFGQPKSAKTGSCLNTVATYQREHCSECFQKVCSCKNRDVPDVLWVDAENRMSSMLYWPASHGINLDCLKIMSPPTGQNVVDFVDHIIRSQEIAKIGLIVVDSIAHIVSMDELNKPTLDGVTVGRSAYLMNQAWKRWTSAVNSLGIQNERKPTILCINQIRHKVGVMYGSPETQPGGLGQEFATSVDVRFRSVSPNYVIFNEKKKSWEVKEKGYKGRYKPKQDETPDFMKIHYQVTASGISPSGRFGEFNYWLQAKHDHRCGDPDNGLQLWDYSKRYGLIEQDGQTKTLFGHTGRTLGEVQASFRKDPAAQAKAREILLEKLDCLV